MKVEISKEKCTPFSTAEDIQNISHTWLSRFKSFTSLINLKDLLKDLLCSLSRNIINTCLYLLFFYLISILLEAVESYNNE